MSGLGGLNKSPQGVVLGLVQLQLPIVQTPDDLARQTDRICAMVAKARRNMPSMDLVVFPEYALHGLSMDTNPQLMCRCRDRARTTSRLCGIPPANFMIDGIKCGPDGVRCDVAAFHPVVDAIPP